MQAVPEKDSISGVKHIVETKAHMIRVERLAALGELAAGLAHEVHNPLDGMQECLRYLEMDPDKSERAAKYYPMLKEGMGRISAVMKGMLTFAISGSKVFIEICSLTDIIDSLQLLVQPSLNDRKLRITWESAASPICLCDRQGLVQAALNLVLNAEEAAEGSIKSEVQIKTSSDSDHAYLIVEDSGPGIPPELHEQIFKPFFTTKPVGEGTGLGLSVSRELIRAIGGNIELAQEKGALGGARFVISLPIAPGKEGQGE